MPILCSLLLTVAGVLMVITGIPAVASSLTLIYVSVSGLLEDFVVGQPPVVAEAMQRWSAWAGLFGLAFNSLQVGVGVGLMWRRYWARTIALVITGLWFLVMLLSGFFFPPMLFLLGLPGLLLLALLHPDGAEQFYAQPMPGVPGAYSEKIVPRAMWIIVAVLVVASSALSIAEARVTVPLAAESVAEGLERARQRSLEPGAVGGGASGAPAGQGATDPALKQGGFFTFTDDKGVTHAVDSWDKIPERYRGKAQRIE